MINKKTVIERILVSALFVILLSSFVSALGIGMSYTMNKPLEIGPGETKEIKLTPNSMISEGDMKLAVKIMKGSEIASLVDASAQVNLPAGGQVPVNIKISIPAGVSEGTEYIVTFNFKPINPPEEAGTVSFNTANEVSMKVIVKTPPPEPAHVVTPLVEKPKGNYSWVIIVIALAVIIAIVAYLFLRKRSQQ